MALASLALFTLIVLAAVFAPVLTRYSPTQVVLQHIQSDAPPSSQHWLGTDGVGSDVYTRLLYGTRAPVLVAIIGAVLCTLIGAITGLLAGLCGGWIDAILTRVTELIFIIPGLLLIVLCVALYGNALYETFGLTGRYIMITIFMATDSWPVIMRLARGEALRLREEQFVEAAVVNGTNLWKITRRHLLPNMLGILVVQGAFLMTGFIYVTAALSIIGLGPPPEVPDIGRMLLDGAAIADLNPMELWAPCAVICTLTITATFIGDGLRDAFDVRAG